jgi:hypothetical protein
MFDALGVENEIIVAPNGKAAHFIARIKGDGHGVAGGIRAVDPDQIGQQRGRRASVFTACLALGHRGLRQ